MMTRKHFEAIAAVFKDCAADSAAGVAFNPDDRAMRAAHATTERIAHDMARMLRRQNPAFNRERFLAACGFPDD